MWLSHMHRIKPPAMKARLLTATLLLLSVWGCAVVYSTSEYQHVKLCLPVWLFVARHAIFLVAGAALFRTIQRRNIAKPIINMPWSIWCSLSLLVAGALYYYLDRDSFFRPVSLSLPGMVDVNGWQVGGWLFGTINPAIVSSCLFGLALVSQSHLSARSVTRVDETKAPQAPDDAGAANDVAKAFGAVPVRANALCQKHGSWIVLTLTFLLLMRLLVASGDLGAVMLLLIASLTALWVSGRRLTAVLCAGCLALFTYLEIIQTSYRLSRWQAWYDLSELNLNSYHHIQMCYSFFTGGWWGTGPLGSVREQFYLPQSSASSTASVLANEYGVIGFLMLSALWAFLFRLCLEALRLESQRRGNAEFSLLHLSSALLFCTVTFHLIFNTGFLPLSDFALPLFSHSGALTVLSYLVTGLAHKSLVQHKKSGSDVQWTKGDLAWVAGLIIWFLMAGRAVQITFEPLQQYRSLNRPDQMPPLTSRGCLDIPALDKR